jgi:hypothetical protein
LTRAPGDQFRAWLLTLSATSKTSRDPFTWVKSLLKYAVRDLELLTKSPWEGLDIAHKTTARRRPWRPEELALVFGEPLFTRYELPNDTKAGADAAYWVPLIGLYTGARSCHRSLTFRACRRKRPFADCQLEARMPTTMSDKNIFKFIDYGVQVHMKSVRSYSSL